MIEIMLQYNRFQIHKARSTTEDWGLASKPSPASSWCLRITVQSVSGADRDMKKFTAVPIYVHFDTRGCRRLVRSHQKKKGLATSNCYCH